LLVDQDVDLLRQLLRWRLEAEGATVVEAATGGEALELAGTQPFDLVLTDLGLPDVSGEAVITGVRSLSQGRTPVAVFSGAPAADLAHALELGAERVFTKPSDLDNLIRYLLGRRPDPVVEATMTVLIVEDDSAMRALLRDVLQRAGHRVMERPDGADLPALAAHESFDAVIVDKELPGSDGLDLLSFLRAHRPAVPVVVVTAFGGPDVAEEAARRGAHRYHEKPFSMSALLETLESCRLVIPRPEA
jgi:DNA-binding response OmpR family regulator